MGGRTGERITRAMNFHFQNKCKYLNCIRDSHRHPPNLAQTASGTASLPPRHAQLFMRSTTPTPSPLTTIPPWPVAPTLRLTCTLNHSFYKQINYVLQENSQKRAEQKKNQQRKKKE